MKGDESLEYKITVLRAAINRYFGDFPGEWSRKDIEGLEISMEEALPTLNKWDKLGFIKIIDSPECFFKTLKHIPDNWKNL